MTLGTSINSHCFHRCFLSYTASMTSVVDKNKHHIHIIYISCKVLQRFDSGLVYKSESGETDSKKTFGISRYSRRNGHFVRKFI